MTNEKEIRSWPVKNGWHTDPETGRQVKFGRNVTIDGELHIIGKVSIGSHSHIGPNVILGRGVEIGNGVSIGNDTILDNNVCIEDLAQIGNQVKVGVNSVVGFRSQLDDFSWAGHNVKIYEYATIGYKAAISRNTIIGDNVRINKMAFVDYNCVLKNGASLDADIVIGPNVGVGVDINVPIFRSASYSMHWFAPNTIKSGCIIKPFKWWEENVERCAEEHGYDTFQQKEYAMYVKQIIEWQNQMGSKVFVNIRDAETKGGEVGQPKEYGNE